MVHAAAIPPGVRIRRVVFERFNDMEAMFTNDEIFELLRSDGSLDPEWVIDDMEPFIHEMCDSGMTRNIGQNFTTIWLKLNDAVNEHHCRSCGMDVHVGASEPQVCPNPSCESPI